MNHYFTGAVYIVLFLLTALPWRRMHYSLSNHHELLNDTEGSHPKRLIFSNTTVNTSNLERTL